MPRPMKASEVLGEFHRLDEWLKSEEALVWLEGYMYMSARQFRERGTEHQFETVYGNARNGAMFRQQLIADLFQARLYQVTQEMVELTTASWRNVRTEVSGLSEWNLPFPYGWAWLDEPFNRMGDDDTEMGIRAISWGLVPDLPGVRIVTWHRTNDLNSGWKAPNRDMWLEMHGHHNLVYTHSNVVPFDYQIARPPEGADDVIRWVKVLWALMDAEISTEQRAGLKPFAMKRFRELLEGKEPEITVILLRRITPKSGDEGPGVHREIDWSLGRIVVQGHLRHIRANYAPIPHHHAVPDPGNANRTCRTCGHEITFVHAYLKGPDGLPIRNAEQLWRLKR